MKFGEDLPDDFEGYPFYEWEDLPESFRLSSITGNRHPSEYGHATWDFMLERIRKGESKASLSDYARVSYEEKQAQDQSREARALHEWRTRQNAVGDPRVMQYLKADIVEINAIFAQTDIGNAGVRLMTKEPLLPWTVGLAEGNFVRGIMPGNVSNFVTSTMAVHDHMEQGWANSEPTPVYAVWGFRK